MTDVLTDMAQAARPKLADRTSPVRARIRVLWGSAKAARTLGAPDVVLEQFTELARETGLISDMGRHGAEDVAHVLSWALRGMNPFEKGPLR
jgi:hypothetical protein